MPPRRCLSYHLSLPFHATVTILLPQSAYPISRNRNCFVSRRGGVKREPSGKHLNRHANIAHKLTIIFAPDVTRTQSFASGYNVHIRSKTREETSIDKRVGVRSRWAILRCQTPPVADRKQYPATKSTFFLSLLPARGQR